MPDTQRGFNINVFRAEIMSRDISRPNLFLAEFVIPPGLADGPYFNTVRRLEYWIEAAALPGVTVQTYQAQRYGYGNYENRPLLNVFAQMQFDVIFDREHQNFDFFNDWLNLTINRDSREGPNGILSPLGALPNEIEYRDNYIADVTIYLYDQLGNITKQIVLREAFPVALAEMRLAWSDNNTFLRMPITMIYNDWYEIDQTPTEEPLK